MINVMYLDRPGLDRFDCVVGSYCSDKVHALVVEGGLVVVGFVLLLVQFWLELRGFVLFCFGFALLSALFLRFASCAVLA